MRRERSVATKLARVTQNGSFRVGDRTLRQVGSSTAPKEGLFNCNAALARSLARAATRLASMRAFVSGGKISSLSFFAAVGDRAVDRFGFVSEGFLKKEVMLFCILEIVKR